MEGNGKTDVEIKLNVFSRLGSWYILALSAIAVVALVGQGLIQSHLKNQLSDSRVVNIAGKQRMLSQKICKTILLLPHRTDTSGREELLTELTTAAALWKVSQEGLQTGNDSLQLPGHNSAAVDSLFAKTAPHFVAMHESVERIKTALAKNPVTDFDLLRAEVNTTLNHEPLFLAGMESIVLQYDEEAQKKVTTLSRLEYLLLFISVLVIAIEIIFIFRPTAFHVNKTVNKLLDTEKNSKKMMKEIMALYASLEKSYEKISHINQPIENPRLLAKSDAEGNVHFITPHFAELSGQEGNDQPLPLHDLFPRMEQPDAWVKKVLQAVSEDKHWEGEVGFITAFGKECWMDVSVTPVYGTQQAVDELLFIGSDITLQKLAEKNMHSKNRAEIDKMINQQKFRSVLILEGQEEERKRIAMDIHDGIGQMLTSLKFQIESIDLRQEEKAAQRIAEIGQIIKQVIKEVRKVTFNLKPTVLGDYGLQAALKVFITEIGKLIDVQLKYHPEGEVPRLPQKIENNIFRIIQEAINNAIKYSQAHTIEVFLHQKENELTISVTDNGVGFDEKIVEARSVNIESGRGFFNMYERTEYINGSLEINSQPGKGTTVTLSVPLQSAVAC